MFDYPVVFVDIETTGGSPKNSRVLEVAAIRVEGGKVVDTFCTLLNPEMPVPYYITRLTGIGEADIVGAPVFADIADRLREICQGAVFVAHFARFDYSFISAEYRALGQEFSPSMLCTVKLSRALYPSAQGHSLEKLLERHSIQVSARHRAYDDALALWSFCQIAYAAHGQDAFAAATKRQFSRATLPPHLDDAYFAELRDVPGVYVFEDEAGAPVYIGKSVAVRTRVMSHFSSDTREAKEMQISRSTHRVRMIETPDELQALLLESAMIKQYMPLYNRMLRRASKRVALVGNVNDDGYIGISAQPMAVSDMGGTQSIWGVYDTRRQAREALERHRAGFDLCPKLLGLEKSKGACFASQLGKCHGACSGLEPVDAYNQRVELAMQRSRIEAWPYETPVSIRFKSNPSSGLVIDNWCVIGRYNHDTDALDESFVSRDFDTDTYRILRSYLRQHAAELVVEPYLV